ncbi:histidine kinase [Blastococcus sp. URHD0036]|uniref:sensor histidine kinase n=1 Tax=Blastococcus sp. URHD0036 TaxID=1380356 RepID=UPI00068F9D4E|nr:histidine kinase [Blastococcus sp. URHD0036]
MTVRAEWFDAAGVATLVVVLGWGVAAVATARAGSPRTARWSAGVAAATAAAYAWPVLVPGTASVWFALGLALPQADLGSPGRRAAAAAGAAVGAAAVVVLVASDSPAPPGWAVLLGWLAVAVGAGGALAARCVRAGADDRARIQLVCAAAALSTAFSGGIAALSVLVSVPAAPGPWIVGALVLLPLATAAGEVSAQARHGAARLLVESVAAAGTALLAGAVYLVVVVGLGRFPEDEERSLLGLSLLAAVVLAVLVVPTRHRLLALGTALVGGRVEGPERVLTGFGARMSRAIPMDELLLQLAESLQATVAPAGAEVWVGDDGALTRTVAVPHRPAQPMHLDPETLRVVTAARIGGRAWTAVWLPEIGGPLPVAGSQDESGPADLRIVPLAHQGVLRGLLVVRGEAFPEDTEQLLVDLGRQLGLALHNVGLDSALQASLVELERRNAELQASRLRIVTAADESRRAIERNLHDGAQQHLVALAVKLGVAAELVDDDPDALRGLLTDLRADVSATIAELRSLAHGIYPPLLRERGLGEALRAAGLRSPLGCRVRDDLPGRLPAEIEAAAYFCCLEAMQNAAKHAGAGAQLEVVVERGEGGLLFEVRDDGAGFDAGPDTGHGFANMADRVGALGGTLRVESAPGQGTSVRGVVPLPAAPAEPAETSSRSTLGVSSSLRR